MTDFLSSLKADLLDRRLLPLLALVGVALVAALAYAVLGGGSTSAKPTAAITPSLPPSTKVGGIAVSQASTSSDQPVAETTSGTSHQRGGPARNPFTPLPGAKTTASSAAAQTSTSSAASGSGSSSSGGTQSGSSSSPAKGSGGTSPAPTTPAKPKPKPQQVYQVDVLFGVAPAGVPAQSIQLTPLKNLTRLDPLTAGGEAPLVFAGVAAGGKSAIFTLVREVILHGPAVCGPSASQCQTIRLTPGQSEELEYAAPGGQSLVYKLQLVSITAVKASAAKAASVLHTESKAGRELLRRDGLAASPGLRYSVTKGVLVVPGHPAFAARAHAAGRRRRHKR
jgi:hypothetical protein